METTSIIAEQGTHQTASEGRPAAGRVSVWKRGLIACLVAPLLAVLAYDLYLAAGSFQAYRLSLRQGFTCRTFRDSTGRESRYIVFVPREIPEENRLPVILFLNGTGENGDDGARQLKNNFGAAVWELKSRFPFLCVAPQCSVDGAWEPGSPDTRRALETLDHVIETCRGDPERVYLTGPSAGGSGVLALGAAYPERFAALIPLAASSPGGGVSVDELVGVVQRSRLPVWAFWNDGDDDKGVVSFNRELESRLLAAGMSPRTTEYHKEGHSCWNTAYRDPALYAWLLHQRRGAPLTRFAPLRLEQDGERGGKRAEGEREGEREGEGVSRSGGGPITEGEEIVLSGSAATAEAQPWSTRDGGHSPRQSFELHFDLRGGDSLHLDLERREDPSPGAPAVAGCRIALRDCDAGGGEIAALDGGVRFPADAIAGQNFYARDEGWNDVRLRVAETRVTLEVNGWEWCRGDVPSLAGGVTSLKFRASGDEARLRHVRVSEGGSAGPSPAIAGVR